MTTAPPSTDPLPDVPRFTKPLLSREGRRPVRVEPVDGTALHPVADRPALGDYLRLLWQRRHFIVADARAKVISGTSGNLLGQVWLVLNPLLDAAVYLVIFGLLLRSSRGIDNFIGYLIIGVFMFGFTTRSVTGGARSVIAARSLVKSFSFPRAALPIATVARETLSFVPALLTMLVLLLFTRPGAGEAWSTPLQEISWRWLLVPLVLLLQLAMNLGLALLAARATTRVPDLNHVIGLAMRFWLYGSAVFFSFDRFISHPRVLELVQLNPMYRVLEITRDCLLYGVTPPWQAWTIVACWAVGLLLVGTVVFWRGEESYGSV
jgi:teichoic acid transport system permease protein